MHLILTFAVINIVWFLWSWRKGGWRRSPNFGWGLLVQYILILPLISHCVGQNIKFETQEVKLKIAQIEGKNYYVTGGPDNWQLTPHNPNKKIWRTVGKNIFGAESYKGYSQGE